MDQIALLESVANNELLQFLGVKIEVATAGVDFYLRTNGDFYINEINTLPGFTKISMYPKMWEATGISYKELITKLIGFGIEKFQEEQSLKTSYLE